MLAKAIHLVALVCIFGTSLMLGACHGQEFPAPLSPREGLLSMHASTGFRVELVASEPLTMDPVAFDWGPDGKLWVVEMADYPLGLDNQGQFGGRVRFLEDTDADGKYDKSTMFLKGIGFPTGVMAWRDGVLVTAAPEIFIARDTDGDGKCDEKTVLYEGFGTGNQQHRVNGLRRGMDGWYYLANGDSGGEIRSTKTGKTVNLHGHDLRIHPDTGDLEAIAGVTQCGRDRDDWGHWFGSNNSNPGFQFVLDDEYLKRNPHVAPPSPWCHVVPGRVLHPLSPTLSRFNFPESANRYTSACGGTIYRDNFLGEDVAGNYFICEPVHNLVHRECFHRDGLLFQGTLAKGDEESHFLRSTDNWFRPVMARTGPDGALWVADMYRAVLEHPEWIPDDIEAKLELRAGHDKGRIYRVVPRDRPLREPIAIDKLNDRELVGLLESHNGILRDLAQSTILWRNDPRLTKSIRTVATESKLPIGRAQAMWTLLELDALDETILLKGLDDQDSNVVAQVLSMIERKGQITPAVASKIVKILPDKNDIQGNVDVQLALAYILGQPSSPAFGRALGKLINKVSDDPYLVAAAMSSVSRDNVTNVMAEIVSEKPFLVHAFDKLLAVAIAERVDAAIVLAFKVAVRPQDGNELGQFLDWQFQSVGRAIAAMKGTGQSLDSLLGEEDLRNLAGMDNSARSVATDSFASESSRIGAIHWIGLSQEIEEDFAIATELLGPQQPTVIQLAVVESLSRIDSPRVADVLLGQWQSYSPSVVVNILDTLLSRESGIRAIVGQLESGNVAVNQVDATRRQQLLINASPELRVRAEQILSSHVSNRQQVIDAHADVPFLSADRERGGALFLKKCASCHQLNGVGYSVGADLSAVGNKSPEALLIATLDPNRAVEDRYVIYVALTDDSRTVSGILFSESGESLTLRGQDGKDQVLLRKNIEELRRTGRSLMPEGFEQEMSHQDLADVFAFIGASEAPAKQFAGNSPEEVLPFKDGSLNLQATACRVRGSTLVYQDEWKTLGFWGSEDDIASWTIDVPADGTFDVLVDYSCDDDVAGNSYKIQVGKAEVIAKASSTGSWETFKEVSVGSLELQAGRQLLNVQAVKPLNQYLIDLRNVRLIPKN